LKPRLPNGVWHRGLPARETLGPLQAIEILGADHGDGHHGLAVTRSENLIAGQKHGIHGAGSDRALDAQRLDVDGLAAAAVVLRQALDQSPNQGIRRRPRQSVGDLIVSDDRQHLRPVVDGFTHWHPFGDEPLTIADDLLEIDHRIEIIKRIGRADRLVKHRDGDLHAADRAAVGQGSALRQRLKGRSKSSNAINRMGPIPPVENFS